jgi:hypothetical protein
MWITHIKYFVKSFITDTKEKKENLTKAKASLKVTVDSIIPMGHLWTQWQRA